MLCVLQMVFDFGCIAGRSRGARERQIAFVAPFGVDTERLWVCLASDLTLRIDPRMVGWPDRVHEFSYLYACRFV